MLIILSSNIKQNVPMSTVSLAIFATGAAALVFGFKKNNRVLLSCAAVLWLLSGTWGEFSHGFEDGFKAGRPNGTSALSDTRHRV
jgi:hypothetical protein